MTQLEAAEINLLKNTIKIWRKDHKILQDFWKWSPSTFIYPRQDEQKSNFEKDHVDRALVAERMESKSIKLTQKKNFKIYPK